MFKKVPYYGQVLIFLGIALGIVAVAYWIYPNISEDRAEIARLAGKVRERGFTLVPLLLYFRDGRAKVEIGLVRGKQVHDKRETLRRRTLDREAEQALKEHR